jgi:hypothetical protein
VVVDYDITLEELGRDSRILRFTIYEGNLPTSPDMSSFLVGFNWDLHFFALIVMLTVARTRTVTRIMESRLISYRCTTASLALLD